MDLENCKEVFFGTNNVVSHDGLMKGKVNVNLWMVVFG